MRRALFATVAPPAPSWTPQTKSGLVWWYDASQLTGLSNNDPISTLTEYSGNFVNGTQSGGARPTYQTNIQNGKPGVLFTRASSQYFNTGTTIPTSWATNAPASWVVVSRYTSLGNGNFAIMFGFPCNTNTTSGLHKRSVVHFVSEVNSGYQTNSYCFTDNTGNSALGDSATQTSSANLTISYNGSGHTTTSNWASYKDNSGQSVTTSSTVNTTNSNGYIGAFPAGGTPSLFWSGYIFEMFGYNTTMSAGDLTDSYNYVKAKWGTP